MGLNIGSNYSILKSGALNEWHRMNLMICFCFDVLCCPFHRKCCPWCSVAAEGCFVLERRKQRARARADEVNEWQLVDSTLLRSMTELTHLLTSRRFAPSLTARQVAAIGHDPLPNPLRSLSIASSLVWTVTRRRRNQHHSH